MYKKLGGLKMTEKELEKEIQKAREVLEIEWTIFMFIENELLF